MLFLGFREVAQSRTVTATWYLANALDLIQNAVIHGWTVAEQSRAIRFLERSDPSEPVVPALSEAVGHLRIVRERATPLAPLMGKLRDAYVGVVRARWFRVALIGILVLQVIGATLELVDLLVGLTNGNYAPAHSTFAGWAVGISWAAAAALTAVGLVALRRSRLIAYQWFRRSDLVAILFIQFFTFLNADLASLVILVVDLLILIALRYMIHLGQEQDAVARARAHGAAVPAPPSPAFGTVELNRR